MRKKEIIEDIKETIKLYIKLGWADKKNIDNIVHDLFVTFQDSLDQIAKQAYRRGYNEAWKDIKKGRKE